MLCYPVVLLLVLCNNILAFSSLYGHYGCSINGVGDWIFELSRHIGRFNQIKLGMSIIAIVLTRATKTTSGESKSCRSD